MSQLNITQLLRIFHLQQIFVVVMSKIPNYRDINPKSSIFMGLSLKKTSIFGVPPWPWKPHQSQPLWFLWIRAIPGTSRESLNIGPWLGATRQWVDGKTLIFGAPYFLQYIYIYIELYTSCCSIISIYIYIYMYIYIYINMYIYIYIYISIYSVYC